MSDNPVLKSIERQEALRPLEDTAQAAIHDAFHSAGEWGQILKGALHGNWLGHPLHAAITDVPVGSWTAATVLDILEVTCGDQYAAGADASVMVGLATAVVAAASGLTDWSETEGGARRVGIVHGLINTATALLYTGSAIARKSRNRSLGRALGFAGFVGVLAGAYLGGELAYSQQVGVFSSPEA